MFRAQQNAFDDVVVKSTDENLTSENWEYILDVVDKVGSSDTGAKDAVAAMIKRLAHRNANVQLYTLELANALSQNCGAKIHKELASRSFTDALLRLTADRNTHQQVKAKILERMAEWSEMFAKDPDLGIMEQAYMKLKTQNPNLRPPSKPQKTQITDSDRMKEEEELQMALALSVKDAKTPAANKSSPAQDTSSSTEQAPQPVPSGTTAATVSRVRALYDFQPSEPGELAFRKGDIIAVLESVYKDWWKGSLRGQTGIFPLNYVEKLQDPTREELQREAVMESEVFGQIRNVEKLLALLSTNSRTEDVRDNEEITQLYHSTLAIRPKLIELIGKYSQKKDDFTQLNEKFIKARRDYESLLEASMSHPPPPTNYGGPQRPYSYLPPAGSSHPNNYPGYAPHNDPQRYFSPPPAENYGQYPPQNGPAPFYMVPPNQQQAGLGQVSANQPARQSPKPTVDPYSKPPPPAGAQQARPHALSVGQQAAAPAQGRPQSMAFPGAPQELATGQFDSPVEAWHGQQGLPTQHHPQAPSAPPSQAPYDPYSGPPPPVGQQHQPQYPPHQPSYDSPTSMYSTDQLPYQQQQQQQQQPPPVQQQQRPPAQPAQPSHPPPGIPSSPPPSAPTGPPAGGYQAYQPGQAAQGRWGSNGSADETFYR